MGILSYDFDLHGTFAAVLPPHFSYARGKLGPAKTLMSVFHMRMFGQGYRRVIDELKGGLKTSFWGDWDDRPSAVAVCRARKKVTAEHCDLAFNAVYDRCSFARAHAEFRYQGRFVVAFDGSRLSLPDSPEIREHFGGPTNQHGTAGVPAAGFVLLWNVSCQQPISFRLAPYRHSEPAVAQEMFDDLPEQSLLITDRGFPSYEITADLMRRGQEFLVRMPRNHGKIVRSFMESPERDVEVRWQRPERVSPDKAPETDLPIRLIKIRLDSGEDEVLMTNLRHIDGHQAAELGRLYTTRWRIETAFHEMKVWYALEDFSARHVLGIVQEVTAVLIFSLLVSEMEAKVRHEKERLVAKDLKGPLPIIRYNRRLMGDGVIGLLAAATEGREAVERHMHRCMDSLWRYRDQRRQKTPKPRVRKSPLRGFKPRGAR
jgi:hypothetical protein